MNVSSVKNLNGSVFSAVQDAELTEVVQTNSASWGTTTIPTDLSANNITANSGLKLGNIAYGDYGLEGYGIDFDRNFGTITILPNTAQGGGGGNYGNINLTSKSGFLGSVATAECSINAFNWNKVNDASDTVVTNSATWSQAGGNPEVESYVQTNSGAIDETVSTVGTNSGVWGGSALPVSAGQGVKINLINNTLVFSNDETLLYDSSAKWTGIAFSEPASNFEKIRVYVNTGRPHIFEWPSNAFTNNLWPGDMYGCGWGAKPAMTVFEFSSNNTGFNVNGGWHTESTASVNWTVLNVSSTWVRPFKVLGINRVAGGN